AGAPTLRFQPRRQSAGFRRRPDPALGREPRKVITGGHDMRRIMRLLAVAGLAGGGSGPGPPPPPGASPPQGAPPPPVRRCRARPVCAVAYSPDGTTIASASGDQTVKLWSTATELEVATLRGHTGAVWCVAFGPDGKTLASGSDDRTIRLLDVATGQEKATLK